jgi:hypothetical protein
VYTLFGSFLPHALHPFHHPHPHHLFCDFLQFCWEDISNNKKDIAFFASLDKDSYTEIPSMASRHKFITTCIDSSPPDLYTASQSLSHIDQCHFKVTVLAPVQWGHQILSSFGFPIYPQSSHMCSPLRVWPKSKKITAFSLDLKSNMRAIIWFLVFWA